MLAPRFTLETAADVACYTLRNDLGDNYRRTIRERARKLGERVEIATPAGAVIDLVTANPLDSRCFYSRAQFAELQAIFAGL